MADGPKDSHIVLNGTVVPYDQARVHVQTPLVRYGAGVFEGVCGYWNPQAEQLQLFRLEEHLRRLAQSAAIMRFAETPSADEIREAMFSLLTADAYREDIHLRVLVWLDGDGDQAATGPIGWSIVATRRGPRRAQGLTANISSWRRIDDQSLPPRVKCVANYANGRLALTQAKMEGYDTTLLLDRNGRVAEAPAACLFVVRDGVVATPAVTDSILESITRATVLDLLAEAGVSVQQRPIDRTELYLADEIFLCGSAQEIAAVRAVDGHPMRHPDGGPVTARAQAAYLAAVRGETSAHAEWRTPVRQSPAGAAQPG